MPKVDSKLVQLIPLPLSPLPSDQQKEFFQFIKQAFSQRRKTLRNSLGNVPYLDARKLEYLLKELNYPADVRAENISLQDFLRLFLGTQPVAYWQPKESD
jgi:16S rRNA (adenine1518-N6/adenine1519-N6)-dimethyltransferase